jgi:hypothetical protein
MQLFVVGGRNRPDALRVPEWHSFEEAVILAVDSATGAATTVVRYRSPDAVCPEKNPSFTFKSGTLQDGVLHVCTQTEVLSYAVPGFALRHRISLPCFNDLHHVVMGPNGNYVVAVTGLDMVVEVAPDGRVVSEWDVLGEENWHRFSRSTDYRKIGTTKPHVAHPNYIFFDGGEPWVTRLEQQDALNLVDGRRIEIAIERVHDGMVRGRSVYFTTVNGYVVEADLRTRRIVRAVELGKLIGTAAPLGWCRGLKLLDDDAVIVGFSRTRPTRLQRNLAWVRRAVAPLRAGEPDWRAALPTRIVCLDLGAVNVRWTIDVEPFGVNAIFSVL